jgi:hypothetical protein
MRDLQTIIAQNDGAAFRELFRKVHGREPEPERMAGFLRCDTYTRDLRIRCLAADSRRVT